MGGRQCQPQCQPWPALLAFPAAIAASEDRYSERICPKASFREEDSCLSIERKQQNIMKLPSLYRRSLGVFVATAAALAFAAGPVSASAKPKPKKIAKITGTINIGVGFPLETDGYPLYYGIAKGIFKKYGITINTTDLTPAAGVGALYSGSINILFDGTGTLNEAVTTHAVKAIGTYSQVPVWLVARPSEHLGQITKISDMAELNGKIIGTSTPGSLVTDVEQSLVRAAHGTASFDYLGGQSGVVAVAHGIVDVTGAVPASLPVAKADGLVVIGSLNKLSGGRGLYTLVGANNAFAKHHARLLQQFNRAYHAALKAANHNVPSLLPVLESSLNISASQAQYSYDLQKQYTFLKPVSLTEVRNDLNNIAAVLPAASTAKYKDVVDNKVMFG